MKTIEEKAALLRRAASDFWWVPERVSGIAEPEITISHSTDPEPLFNQAIPHRMLSDPFETVARVEQLHGDASRWWITETSDDPRLIAALKKHGYEMGNSHGAYIVDATTYSIAVPDDVKVERVETAEIMSKMYDARCEIFGNARPADHQLALELSQCTGPDARVARFVAWVDGEVAGTGSQTFFDDLSFSFIWAGGVREHFRHRGVYKRLIAARAQACRDRGIQFMGLYARDETSAPIVEAHGFERCGWMTYYEKLNHVDT